MALTDKDRYILLSRAIRIANSATLSYQSRLKSLAKFLASIFSCQSVNIYICDDSRRYLSSAISSTKVKQSYRCRLPIGHGIAGRCAARREPLCEPFSVRHPKEIAKGTEQYFYTHPIFDERTIYGVVALGMADSEGPSGQNLDLFKDLLEVIAGIIHRIGISAASQRRINNLTILSELGALLNRSAPLESLVPIVLETCQRQTGSCCIVFRLAGVDNVPKLRQHRVIHSARKNLATLLGIEDLCSAKVRHSGISLLISDLVSDEALPLSYVCVPLKFENRVQGTVTFFGKGYNSGEDNFTEEDRDLFESMALLVSNAIAGAVNYQQVLRLSQENNHKLKELALLYRLSNTMLSTIRLNKLMHLILSALTCGPNPLFERAMLFLINERAGVMQGMLGVTTKTTGLSKSLLEADFEISLTSRWDITEEEMARQQNSEFSSEVRGTRLELNKSKNMSSRAVLERRMVHVPDALREKHVDRDFVKRFGINSFAATPLLAKEKVLGVIVVDNPYSSRLSTVEELRFLELCTNQAGMAIESSLLYSQIEDANRKLRDAHERLIHGERLASIGEMAAGIAHELKSPLVSIGGFARRLQRKLQKGSEESGYVSTIVGEVVRLEKMLSDILSFSRKSTLCYSVCSMQEIIEDAIAVVLPPFEESKITVMRSFSSKVLSFLGDGQQIKQVFINLFTNAKEAMQGGAGEIRVTATTGRYAGKEAVIVKVADTGGGIPLAALNNIFNPFYTTKESGTGLGIPIANRIISNHGGKLQVNNYPGVGVEFVIIFPAEPPAPMMQA
ncbi:signal transduction histidine-protein kinase AtoS [Geobacter sp. OR-1]|uniref:GAF domain-containing protein n=1 Tax=Geobacter sp. OR-1 TaxID=1266765 RepID=UPI0005422B4D|nr:GAF domain-containing protein [Geobacter sp. OR-1]GAM09248.1 signal transduction histidine-protein kinase AtoS [Geobacter sp. OR-1]